MNKWQVKLHNSHAIKFYLETGKKIYAKDLKLKKKEMLFEEKGIYNLQLLVYAAAIYDEFKNKDIKTGIISLKNRKEGFLTAFIGENEYLSETEIGNCKEIIYGLVLSFL